VKTIIEHPEGGPSEIRPRETKYKKGFTPVEHPEGTRFNRAQRGKLSYHCHEFNGVNPSEIGSFLNLCFAISRGKHSILSCEVRVPGCEIRVACCGLRGAGYGLRVAGYGLRVAGYEVRVSGYEVRGTSERLARR